MSVHSCKNIRFLDIEKTSVSGEGLKHLKGLTRLNMLICDGTKINGNNLIEFTKHISSITRLNLNRLDVSDEELLEVSKNC